jgi:hypothetical protein
MLVSWGLRSPAEASRCLASALPRIGLPRVGLPRVGLERCRPGTLSADDAACLAQSGIPLAARASRTIAS